MQRDRVGLAANVSRDHRHSSELAHRPGVAEDDAVQQGPLHVRQRHAPEGLPTPGTQADRRLFLLAPLLLHEWDYLAGDVGEGDEHRG